MTKLDCLVTACVYNEEKSCCKDGIIVVGDDAANSGDTCCGSFRQRNGDRVKDSVLHPSKMTEVDCEATNCVYNKNCRCKAEHVGINGSSACDCRDTECATFKCECGK